MFTRHCSSRFSHSFVRDEISFSLLLSLSLPPSFGHYLFSFSVSRNSCTADGSPLLSLDATVFLLSSSVFLPLLLSGYLAHSLLSLSLSLFYWSIFCSRYSRQQKVTSGDSFLADDDVRRARNTHFPLFPLLSLSRDLRSLSSTSIHHFCLSRFLAFARARAHNTCMRTHTNAAHSGKRTRRPVDRFSVILSLFRSRNTLLRSHARTIRDTDSRDRCSTLGISVLFPRIRM